MKELKLKQLLLVVLSVLIMTAPVLMADDAEPRQSTSGPEPPVTVQERDVIRALGVPPIAPVVIGAVPDYMWRHGCGPTATGNVVGYYDGQGYADLIPGDASTQTAAVDQAIASQGSAANPRHYEDYSLPIDSPPTLLLDKSEPPFGDEHPNDCIADFQMTSWSRRGNYYGWGYDTDVGPSFVDYINMINPAYSPAFVRYRWGALTWSILTTEIDNGRPMVFLVDTDGDGSTDHFVTIVGYDTATGQYGCHDTWAPAGVRWESFQGISAGNPWGIYSGIAFKLAPLGLKWKQPPDETENGIDIRCDRSDGIQRVLADDFKCTTTGPITKIVFWGSWKNDIKGKISNIHLSIHDDMPANDPANPNNFSMPRSVLWTKDVGPADFNEMVHYQGEPEWCWDPAGGQPPIQWCDAVIWKYVIPIDPSVAFTQQGDPCNPIVYWLDIHVMLEPDDRNPEFGCKTTPPEYHWNDDAVCSGDDGTTWNELIYPSQHPYAPGSVDLSFAIVTEEAEEPNDIKWSQPPIPIEPDNLFYGWNEISEYDGNQIVADDWLCDNDDPVTDIHWWGSFKDWKGQDPPVVPSSFHITIWTDVPDPSPDDPTTFSHPNEVVWEIDCANFDYRFVGWDYDPITKCYEACFLFEQYLTEAEYFYQHTSPDGTPAVYWISIAANYPAGTIVEHPWGWKTRPRKFNDDAVRIRKPTNPHIGDQFEEGKPIYWPDPNKSWDMAFELTAQTVQTINKWEQDPNPQLPGLHCHDSQDASGYYSFITLADDWQCQGGAVTDLHWYGNYETDAFGNEMRRSGIRYFHISIHKPDPDNPCLPDPMEAWGIDVLFTDITETDTGLVNNEGCRIYLYEYDLPDPFPQELGQYYWLDLTAFSHDPIEPALWRWQEAGRGPMSILCGAVSRTGPLASPWQTIIWPGDPERYSDMAFVITSTGLSQTYVKWSQPPVRYKPRAYDGWNERSMYGMHQIAADDWFCRTDQPVADIHWWGSFLGWSCEDPPEMPEMFHIAIWTDVPATPGTSDFSHPNEVIWETFCSDFTCEFVGWDIDPRYYGAPPEACFKFEQDLPEEEWFYQKPGGNIYWISIAAIYPPGTNVEHEWGWKTRRRNPNSPAPDDAVRIWDPMAPVVGSIYGNGEPIWWPDVDDSWDLAFELTTKEKEPKKPVPHLKWSQPPIEMDPSTEIPIYCGWDEKSYAVQVAGAPPIMKVVADDYRCIGSMPVTSLHWWGSYVGWDRPQPPLLQPHSWLIGFWSNVPASGVVNYSHPETLLWYVQVPAHRVKVEFVGHDEFPLNPLIFPESCFQYYVDLLRKEIFWQGDFLDMTQDNTFWVSIVAVYPDTTDVEYPWGWKTRPWKWMDDAVTFDFDGDIPIGTILDPANITPIEYGEESYDVAFELDTDPNYIKWEQPFTGIRHWPHYHDEESMALESEDGNLEIMRLVADDWKCESETPITAAVWWGSYIGYRYQPCQDIMTIRPRKPDYFRLSIWTDVPAGADTTVPFSHPNEVVWKYNAFEYDEVLVGYDKDPRDEVGPPREPVFRYSVRLPRDVWFFQEDVNNIYWFSVVAVYKDPLPNINWGWTNHPHVFNDDAVAGYLDPAVGVWNWEELYDQVDNSEDMSFMLFTDPDPILGTCWDADECAGQPNGDATCDGSVNFADLIALKLSWLKSKGDPAYNCCADFDQSTTVNFADLIRLKLGWLSSGHAPANYETSCPP